jgi:2-polyprenyl-3-methyl-5-hydroxy-6-metoxy-1,4-benzoquinol methylase
MSAGTASRSGPAGSVAAQYWERRARRFAGHGDGLAAVCSYGMPVFYNRSIQLTQRLALAPWLAVTPGTHVLDVGCGVGRWSCRLAARGALVDGIDLSPTMIKVAQQRAAAAGLAAHCRFRVQDLAMLDTGGVYDLVLGVTVLQHILDSRRLRAAIERLAAHVAPGGRLVLLEAAPARDRRRCDSAVFTARTRREYLDLFDASGLRLRSLTGVDPAPFKIWLLPHLQRLPRPLGLAALATVTALSLPVDAALGRRAARSSWHAVFVLEHARSARHGR